MKYSLLAFLISTFLFSCQKLKKDTTQTKVGFYLKTTQQQPNDQAYSLYIDDNYAGDINAFTDEPNDSSLLLFQTLDSKKHYIDIKNKNGEWISANYLQIKSNCTSSGTATRGKNIQGMNGSSYNKTNGKPYGVYAGLR